MADDKKTLKFQMMMSPSEAKELDDWMFANRIRSRAEAIRRLCRIALTEEDIKPEVTKLTKALMDPVITLANEALCEKSRTKEDEDKFRKIALDIFTNAYRIYEKQIEKSIRIGSLIDGTADINAALDWEARASEYLKNNSFLDNLHQHPEALKVLEEAIEKRRAAEKDE